MIGLLNYHTLFLSSNSLIIAFKSIWLVSGKWLSANQYKFDALILPTLAPSLRYAIENHESGVIIKIANSKEG